jgi:chromatin structure-remodeling complex subunit RSC1/2
VQKKIKRRDYKRMETFVADMNLMFNNAKAYNADESQIFNDAVTLQVSLS